MAGRKNEGNPETKSQRNTRHAQEDSDVDVDEQILTTNVIDRLETVIDQDKNK